jgi:hypothetical protein
MKNKELKVISFKNRWHKIKKTFVEDDFYIFYEVIHKGKDIDRAYRCSNREFNSKYMSHYFPVCRCHTNVLFPLFLLNDRGFYGKYSMITNANHSAIINTETNEIYDPTYEANGVSLEVTLKQFKDIYEIITLENYMVESDMIEEMQEMQEEYCMNEDYEDD